MNQKRQTILGIFCISESVALIIPNAVRSAKFIDEANKERYIEHNISVKRQKFFKHLTEDTSSQHTDYRGINIFSRLRGYGGHGKYIVLTRNMRPKKVSSRSYFDEFLDNSM